MTNPTTPSERERFEVAYRAEWKTECPPSLLRLDMNGEFESPYMSAAFFGWKLARATAKREPLTDAVATCAAARCKSQNVVGAFVEGVRYAEQHHGIEVTK